MSIRCFPVVTTGRAAARHPDGAVAADSAGGSPRRAEAEVSAHSACRPPIEDLTAEGSGLARTVQGLAS